MNIGEVANASGVSAKMIRYYERIALIRPADRTDGNYRSFSDRDVSDLRFIKRARSLGFTLQEITNLLALWRNSVRPSSEAKVIADRHIAKLEARIAEMRAMTETLKSLSQGCAGDDRPNWAILPDFDGGDVNVES